MVFFTPLSCFFAVLLMFSIGKIKRYSVALYYPLSTDVAKTDNIDTMKLFRWVGAWWVHDDTIGVT